MRRVVIAISLLLVAALLGVSYLVANRREQLQFSATGYLETITHRGQGCELRVAIYDWISLSPNFPVAEVPRQDDRYILRALGDTCTAATVAAASTPSI
jgi:hypothetical protein